MKEVRFFQSIQIRLIIIYVLLILIAMQLIGVYFVETLENSFVGTFKATLNNQAYLIAQYVEKYLANGQDDETGDAGKTYEDLNVVVNNLNTVSKAEIQIIDANGVVVTSTSAKNQKSVVGQKNTQTEVRRALQGIRMNASTLVDADGVRKMVIAMPVESDGKVIGAVYMVASMEDLYADIRRINRILVSGTLFALGLTAVLGVVLSNTITNPIKAITRQATAMAEGDFNQQVRVNSKDEIGQLGRAFNYMTDRLKEALFQNEEEKEKLASILINMNDGVVATDDQGRVIVMNVRAREILQIKEKDMDPVGRDIADLLGLSKPQIDQYVLGETNTVIIDESDGGREHAKRIRVTFSPIHRRGKGITGTIAVLQDVTEQEAMEQSRREFVANVSHELRTPLTTIKSYLEALGDGALDDRAISERFVGVTLNETERMIRLVNDLLQLSRLDSKQTAAIREPTDLKEMLEDVADRFSFQLQQKAIGIHIRAESNLPMALLDSDQIDQVLDNLVSNAIKYTADGGRITIRARRTGRHIEVAVEDTGIGIPENDLGKIFDRFYRVDKARSRNMGGTGLGLSIAREIIKAHGGQIRLDSVVNKGTTVTFTLPVYEEGGGVA